MTKQEIFDVVVRGLASQGWQRSWDVDLQACVYNGPEGIHCAAGWLLDHLEIDVPPDSNNSSWENLEYEVPKVRASFDNDASMFIAALQAQHDVGDICKMKQRFQGYAKEISLTWPADVS